jgi:phosphoribosylanthranilate isomerase
LETVQIKICGITCLEDARLLNCYGVDYAGFVLFYPKSKRNLSLEKARLVMEELDASIQKVAVVVSPDGDQIKQIQQAGFDIIQIHGQFSNELADQITIPIFRAFHIEECESIMEMESLDNVTGFVLDGQNPGSGKVFNWELTSQLDRQKKRLMLAGGLHADNVMDGIEMVHPDIVDVSSGVEKESGIGKDPDKVRVFVETVRSMSKDSRKEE